MMVSGRRSGSRPALLAAVVWLALAGAPCRAQGLPGEWLNARECGASGSEYETTAATTAGSKQITVKEPGDFKVGQGVMVSKCHPRITKQVIWGPRGVVAWERPLKGLAEIRGYNGDQGDWLVLVLDVAQGTKSFRWSEDICRTWKPEVPITGDWQPLRDGIEVKFNPFEWETGNTVVFAARGQLVTTIEKIEGNVLTLRDAATRTAPDAVVKHCDDAALQEAINRAMKEKRHLLIPPGRYRLSKGLRAANPQGLTIQGSDAVNTVLDISDGEGACITSAYGTEITLRNLTFVGHSGFEKRDQCGWINTKGSSYFWGFAAKNCNATTIAGTERALVENCHGVRMASECFVAACTSRGLTKPGQSTSTGITYLRCTATDLGRNAFNDVTCGPENTSILHCRIVDVGGCAWEGASRFVKFIGNYVRNAGTVAMGNLGPANRDASYPALGAGQHIIADNVFESNVPYGGCAIRTAFGATQVIIRNNLFINFNSSAVEASGGCDATHYPSANTTITGNLFDLTCVDGEPKARFAIQVSASDAVISNNQIYVRGECDPRTTGIRIAEPAVNVLVHDNLIRNCGTGIVTARAQSRVAQVVDTKTFASSPAGVPFARPLSHLYRGWNVVWLSGGKPAGRSVVDAFDPRADRFTLREPREMKAGDVFEVYSPDGGNWSIHRNTITGCLSPAILDSYGGPTALFRDNVITRGGTAGVKQAVEVRGRFELEGNQISGFNEAGSAALGLYPDRFGQPMPLLCRGNVFDSCAAVATESQPGLWNALTAQGNLYPNCAAVPK